MPPPAETAIDSQHTPTASVMLSGWGGGPPAPATLLRPAEEEELRTALADRRGTIGRGAIARGMGRSYGDAAQLHSGLVIDMTGLGRFELDRGAGTVTAQGGATIAELLDAVVPEGWVVPVVPGTQHVTVGGAIASDIHGKNHGTVGTFGSHVLAMGLLGSDGEIVELRRGAADRLFEATLGGMGLTGVIVWAQIALRAVSTALLSVDTDRAASLDHALSLLSEPGGSHRVAWLDLLGSKPGRGIVTRAEHVAADAVNADAGHVGAARTARPRPTVRARATVPPLFPGVLLRPSTVAASNELRFRRAPRHERGREQSFGTHMFPLDALEAWPRLYGRQGLVQYQLVVPPGEERVLHLVIEYLSRARIPCYLAVLKDFGPANSAPLSFPIEGWTLALDLPRSAPGLTTTLERCDELVAAAGGRVYLSKDSRMRPEALEAMYPRLSEWKAIREHADPEGLWRSDLALRTGLVQR